MAWTAPKTWAVAEFLQAANFNTHIRDNLAFLKATPVLGSSNVGAAQALDQSGVAAWTSVQVTTFQAAVPASVDQAYLEWWAPQFYIDGGVGAGDYAYAAVDVALSPLGWTDARLDMFETSNVRTGSGVYMRSQPITGLGGTTQTATMTLYAYNCLVRMSPSGSSPIVVRLVREQ